MTFYRYRKSGKEICESKRRYRSKKDAGRTKGMLQKRFKQKLRAYKCSHCKKWHLTSRVRKEIGDKCK